jgi:type IV pilus assembly protein PilB
MADNNKPTTSTAPDFIQYLFDAHTITAETRAKLDEVLTKSGIANPTPQQIVQVALDEHLADEEELAKARAGFFHLPYVDLRKVTVPKELVELIPEESRNFYHMVAFAQDGNRVKVALMDPASIQALEALEFLGQKNNSQIQIHVASEASLSAVFGSKKNISTVVGQALEDIQEKEATEQKTDGVKKITAPQVIEDAPIIKIVDVILSNAIEANASDIHIEPSDNDVRVRYRIDGILHTSLRLPRNVFAAVVSRIKILSNLKIDETRLPQDGRFHVDLDKKSVDLRVSTLPLMYGEKIVMRILDKTASVPTLDQLGLRGLALQWVMENIKKTNGVFLITGPTGSGKSTTLYSLLSLLNTTSVNIVTLEDPVEYFMEGVNQSQVNPEIGLTFASGLRSILRQDPNIVMVGEIRDEETAELAVHAALTGHLVFSTLHTNNSVGAIPRMVNMGLEPFLLSASMNAVMAQRLVRKLCMKCRKVTTITPIVEEELRASLPGVPPVYTEGLDLEHFQIYEAVGCEACNGSGYKGRIGIFEVLPIIPEMQELLFGKTPAYKIYEAGLKLGMISMKQDGVIKVLRGETTMDEIVRVTTE